MAGNVYLTGFGAYLPGEPLDSEQMARRLGAGERGAALRARVLAANGIRTRHYALDERGEVTMLNEELAAEAVRDALKDRDLPVESVGMLAAGTTQGDLLVPGFASMVHGRLGGPAMELLSAGGVCASSMTALAAAARAVRLGEHDAAVVVGSELVSRSLRQSRYEGARSTFDAEFLRWTLSDGAGAVVLEGAPRPGGLSLRLDWTHVVSYANERQVCMSAGGEPVVGQTWQDGADLGEAVDRGLIRLRQDVKNLPALFQLGLREFMALVRAGRFRTDEIEHVLCHYSAEHFRGEIFDLLRGADLMIDEQRWFTNLHSRGNTGAASIFVMLEEAWRTGRFKPGDRTLLIVPESGRYSLAFAHLTCVDSGTGAEPAPPVRRVPHAEPVLPARTGFEPTAAPVAATPSPLGQPLPEDGDEVRWTVLELARVWGDFERQVRAVPLVRRIDTGTATLADYRRLLLHLRQQVVEGGRWISRAASNFSVELFALRSAAIKHAAEEHRDYQLLERDFVAAGGELAEIQGGRKNIGSEALSAYMFHQASQPDPVDLLGAMFIIEGLGTALALGWADSLREQLALREDQVRFLAYHGEADDGHFAELAHLLREGVLDAARAARVVRTAEVVARLYALQLAEVDA
ncbi:3-oxoacyl-[acyl-carrier-protein] synthase III C-terminal domain-containing protein [Catellatospora sp. KI3]|uniref:3-oxoacyl-[acyl-carrier-protein] synthase III C-terminal domain-containing protein n=1 Tax=Catellatospora sp. KI3 TaxID=3041620 RepID=UPI002482840E|nr:3-oxoacyl-[acyl-carrier-protein] synthase III C-terminal domain-containing protein [Catellatospora sp. KI3]MDI1462456.1 3-oxoacyl-[acyl-carrier-protein] synthase III C-terminal domain-containing protein [Catellatospora sp. KI3]